MVRGAVFIHTVNTQTTSIGRNIFVLLEVRRRQPNPAQKDSDRYAHRASLAWVDYRFECMAIPFIDERTCLFTCSADYPTSFYFNISVDIFLILQIH